MPQAALATNNNLQTAKIIPKPPTRAFNIFIGYKFCSHANKDKKARHFFVNTVLVNISFVHKLTVHKWRVGNCDSITIKAVRLTTYWFKTVQLCL